MKYVAPLRDDAIPTLHDMPRYHPSRRARMRAHSLLLSHPGYSIPHIAHGYQVDRRRVSTWIDRWQTMGLVGLADKPGSGRRPLLNAEAQHKVHASLQQYPKDVQKVVQALEQETAKRVSTQTIKRFIKKRSVWKRIKTSPAKTPEPHQDERSKVCIQHLQRREGAGEGELWYVDVTGFCLPPLCPLCLATTRCSYDCTHGQSWAVAACVRRSETQPCAGAIYGRRKNRHPNHCRMF